jgi:hypothetical protein
MLVNLMSLPSRVVVGHHYLSAQMFHFSQSSKNSSLPTSDICVGSRFLGITGVWHGAMRVRHLEYRV